MKAKEGNVLRRELAGFDAKTAELTLRVEQTPGDVFVLELKNGRVTTYHETSVVAGGKSWKSKGGKRR